MSENTSKSDSIFWAALEIADPQQRDKYLEEECRDDDALRAQVAELIAAYPKVNQFLEQPAANLVATIDETSALVEKPGTQIGPYTIREKLGEGGMGVVYVAEQKTPVRRKVALKIVKPGMDTQQVLARFEAERQALAMMDHPNIANVLDGGTTSDVRDQKSEIRREDGPQSALTSDLRPLTSGSGRPYFVMELVKGIPITEFCDEQELSTLERLELFMQVCRAVQHAHTKGVIHRDIKPSNVLVTLSDGRPVPKVIDFGVSKALSQQLTDKTVYTAYGQLVGTPLYMSPEQAQLSAHDVDTRSDIYSLGVLLYELLTGSTPFDKQTLQKSGFDEMRHIIREVDPPRPSARISTLQAATLSTVSGRRCSDAKKLSHSLRGELDWIVMKALEKDRTRRYETANSLARDIERYLNDEPIQARPPSTAYRFQKFARRNKGILTAAAIVGTALVLGISGTTWQALRATQAEQDARTDRELAEEKAAEAQTEAARAHAVVEFMQDMLASANPDTAKGSDYTVRELLDGFSAGLESQLHHQPEVEATLRQIIGSVYTRLRSPDDAEPHLRRALELRREVFGEDHADFEKAIELEPDNARFLSDDRFLNSAAWSFVRYPHKNTQWVEQALTWAQRAAEMAPETVGVWNTLGVACYRTGNWQDAVNALEQSEELYPHEHLPFNGFFLAMAHWQLGHQDEARQWYDKAVESVEKKRPNREEELRRFRAEAEELMGIEKQQKHKPQVSRQDSDALESAATSKPAAAPKPR